MKNKVKVFLVQLGSPAELNTHAIRKFLNKFLSDKRVIDLNPIFWQIILKLFILPFRPSSILKNYQKIWTSEGSPLIFHTKNLALAVQKHLPFHYEVLPCFLLSSPTFQDELHRMQQELLNSSQENHDWIIIPQFPQYSECTTGSVLDQLADFLKKSNTVRIGNIQTLLSFHDHEFFIEQSVLQIEKHYRQKPFDDLLLSFHGIPTRRVTLKKDPYYTQCLETYTLIKERVENKIPELQNNISLGFQSRFGSEQWLEPNTIHVAQNILQQKQNQRSHEKPHTIGLYAPSFTVDCLETLDELGNELQTEVDDLQGKIELIPCLNDGAEWSQALAQNIEDHHAKTSPPPQTTCNKNAVHTLRNELMNEQKLDNRSLKPEAKSTLKIIFLILFLDLVGFSIIFPLFPAMAKHYLFVDPQNVFLTFIFNSMAKITGYTGPMLHMNAIVLFGGVLGALYSFLQFIMAPFWGSLSDKIGRRPVLLISMFGLFLSYVLWFFSGSFTLLILARFIGGIMAGNISTATAVVADITSQSNRSKGMAIIGIAFAFGFIIGPAIGGLTSLIDLTAISPQLQSLGVNPFSMPALVSAILTFFAFILICVKFKETLPAKKQGVTTSTRKINPVALFKPLPFPGVNLTNFSHFLFLTAFSGMEFTLTFLAVERLGYTSLDNAYMFIYIGLIIALVQGGFVRRKAHDIGEKKVSLMGLIIIIPGLLCIGFTQNTFLLYLGLTFLAIGSAFVIPCMTALVSLYAPKEHQGVSLGTFRSLGALARVIGPLIASVLYFRMNSQIPYVSGAIMLLIPLLLIIKLPQPQKSHI